MNTLRRIAQIALDINKLQADLVVKIYGELGLYRRIYKACGMPEDLALRIEERMLAEAHVGVEEQHALVSRWVRGEIDFRELVGEYKQWFASYVDRCGDAAAKVVLDAA